LQEQGTLSGNFANLPACTIIKIQQVKPIHNLKNSGSICYI
jgi:hypothetical protein